LVELEIIGQNVAQINSYLQILKMFSKMLATAGLIAGLAISAVHAIPTISAVGSKFFDSDGKQFYIKGTSTASLRRQSLIVL